MAMKVFNVGDVLGAADVNEYLVNTRFAVKPSDTSRNTTTTFANDPDLTVAVDANKSYALEMFLNYTAQAGQDLKYTFSVPASASLNGGVNGLFVASTTFALQPYDSTFTVTSTVSLLGQTVFDTSARISGILATAGTAGSITLRWAQNTSGGNNTIVRAGSYMLLRRVA